MGTSAKGYDFIIVGGGSAGCVLANRLSEDGAAVLLLEAGGRDWHPYIHIPIGMGRMHEKRMFDWDYDSEPQPNLDNRRIELHRGKVLGGSSSINVMAFTRGHPGDYDRWADNGAPGWSFADVLPYFRKVERWEGGESQYRGSFGPVGVEFARTDDPLFPALIAAGRAAGFPVTDDYNGEQPVGFGRAQFSIRDGRRSSAANAYLKPIRGRRNLTIVTGAQALRVTMSGTTATGIAYAHGSHIVEASASREVILSGGTFNTPQLLMLSGVGHVEHLREHGIAPLIDLPVGDNLQDHLATTIYWSRPERGPFHATMRFDRMTRAMAQAQLFASGPGTVVPGGAHAFLMSQPGLAAPDIEFMFRGAPRDAWLWMPGVRPGYRDGWGIRPALLHPKSRGTVRLRSTDPRAPVRIDPQFLSHPDDLPVLRKAVKLARETGRQAPLDPFRGEELSPGPTVQTDDEIDAFIRRSTITVHHPAATCPIGAVLDPDLRVRGAERLRVVDASAMPDLISAHLNACVLMMAEKAADLIRGKSAPSAP